MTEPDRRERWLEIVSTVLLALATVATAWAGFQSRQWTGQQAQSYSRGNAARVESTRASDLANRQGVIDVATFIEWVNATKANNNDLATFYRTRFRAEFKPAFEAWIATQPLTDPTAPATPFAMPTYQLAANTEADRLEQVAATNSAKAQAANERANNYVGALVLFASALFFAGIGTKVRSIGARTVIVGLGCLLFVGTLAWLASLPLA
jgi:hypothetical protein